MWIRGVLWTEAHGHARIEWGKGELCRIVGTVAEEYGIERVYISGSRARGDNGHDSDYDFCVRVPKDIGFFRLSGFSRRLSEAIEAEVDIVNESIFGDNGFSRALYTLVFIYEERHIANSENRSHWATVNCFSPLQ